MDTKSCKKKSTQYLEIRCPKEQEAENHRQDGVKNLSKRKKSIVEE
jgi:hypothetical protein